MSEREKLVEIVREALWRQNFAAHEDAETVQRQKEAWRHEWDRSLTKATDLIAALEAAGVRLVPDQPTEHMEREMVTLRGIQDNQGWKNTVDIYRTGVAASPYAKENGNG